MQFRTVPALFCLTLAGCGPNIEEAIAAHGAKVEQKLASVKLVGSALPTTPMLQKDGVEGSPRLVLQRLDPKPGGNAALIYLEDFRELTELSLAFARPSASELVPSCAALVRTQREPWDARRPSDTPGSGFGYSASRKFEACSQLEYLIVLRTLAFSKPVAPRATDAGAASPAWVFDGGYLKAEVLVFALEGAKLLGGFRFEAESSDKVQGTTESTLDSDFGEQFKRAFTAVALQHLPNGTFEL